MEEFQIASFNKGKTAAFNYVYQQFNKPLHYFAYSIINDYAESQDIVSEVMIKLWEKRMNFTDINGIRAFLYVATRHACIDLIRARKRHESAHDEISYLSQESEILIDEKRIQAEILHKLYVEIRELPPQCGQVFKLLFFGKKTTSEIAALMGIQPQTVLNQKTRALQLLRAALLKKDLPAFYLWILLAYCTLFHVYSIVRTVIS
ncbi:RNA polymerase sigma factor [Chitinophaga sp. 30R24]|uniref:RNA polymerase sigma factor n=1 Tax=Chitinophaga sp. 30R24 TaxID=3248838 RepID=UPI003B8FB537